MSGSLSEDSAETKKLPDKTRTHAFILELEQGTQEALKQRSVGKFDRLPRKELHSKERREKERSVSDERAKLKSKQADESQQRDGAALKVSSEEKTEKKPKVKSEKKMAGAVRDGKSSLSEVGVEEAAVKKAKAPPSVESIRVEKDRSREREKERSKDKAKGEKTSAKSDFKQTSRHEYVSLFEDRADVDLGSDGSKKKEKYCKDVLKRSKSHSDDRTGDKSKKEGEREKTKMDQDGQKSNRLSSELDREPKKVKLTEKGKTPEKSKSKSKEETKMSSKMDIKAQGPQGKSVGAAPASKEKKRDTKEPRKVSEDTQHDRSEVKSTKKKKEKRDGSQEEKKTSRDDKLEKSEKSSKLSAAAAPPVSLVAEEPVQKAACLQDDPVAPPAADTTAAATSLLDDTCDALSDITPEPPEGELESRLAELSAVPGETDALLTLMDVCTSAEAQLPPAAATQMSEREADMKMKEAALTLLSMDCGAVTCQDVQGHQVEPPLPPSMETAVDEQEKEEEQEHRQPAELTAPEPTTGLNQASEQPEAEKETNTAGMLTATTHDGGQ